MSRWTVDPGRVGSGGHGVRAAGEAVGDLPGALAGPICAIGAASGSGDIAEAAATAARRWGSVISQLGLATAGLGRAAGRAAATYEGAESSSTEAFGGPHG